MKKLIALILVLILALAGTSAVADMAGKQVALMTPYLGSVTTNLMVEYMKADLEERGAVVTVINTNNDFAKLASEVENIAASGQTDAIVLVSADPSLIANQLQEAFEAEIPVFGCDSGFIEGMHVNATSDNYQMGSLIVRYLFDDLMGGKGTVIALTHRPHPGVVKRCEAFDEIIKEYPDITLITEQHVPAEQPINDAQSIVENLLLANSEKDSVTAIWAAWDEPAIGATQALKEAGYRIPEDVSVVGFDDISSAQYVSPPLTTVQVPKTYLGEVAVGRVVQLIEGRSPQPLKVEVFTRLVRRKSVLSAQP